MDVGETDGSRDYYGALGLHESASLEELKAAYVALALKYHPDTNPNHVDSAIHSKQNANQASEFIKVAEAWSVLSKPELKSAYDRSRSKYLGKVNNSFPATGEDHRVISEGFNTQRLNYAKVQNRAAGSNWMEQQEKYKSEKWQNLPLSERKSIRARPIRSISGSVAGSLLPAAIFFGLGTGLWLALSK